MSQKSGTLNFVIHDANGQPRMVKVVQGSNNQQINQINLKQNPLKIIKLPTTEVAGTTQQVQAPVYHTIKLNGIKCTSKVVQLPVETITNIKKKSVKTECVELEGEEVQVQIEELEDEEEANSEPVLEQQIPAVVNTSVESKPNMSYTSRRRHNADDQAPEYTTKRRKHADKVGKGLRHFSMKVCEKVRTKGFTSYNEVADELVAEFAAGMHGSADSQQYDQKNIRRRVYDALNVLMAMNIISKEKKEIRWIGLPTNTIQECNTLEKEKQAKLERIQKKTQQLQELIFQHISFKSLIERNKEAETKGVKPSPSSAIHLPFIVVNTSDKALIDCSISNDKTEYMFNFNKKFQIHDDIDILKRMGLLFGLDKGECSEEDIERAKSMVPKSLEEYVEKMGRGTLSTNMEDLLQELEQETAEDALEGDEMIEERLDDDDGAPDADHSDASDDVYV